MKINQRKKEGSTGPILKLYKKMSRIGQLIKYFFGSITSIDIDFFFEKKQNSSGCTFSVYAYEKILYGTITPYFYIIFNYYVKYKI